MTWELVGRAATLATVAEALSQHRLVALTGAPGVGKSRLLAEASDQFETSTRPSLRVLATPSTRTVPLAPFVHLVPAEAPSHPSLLLAAVVDALEALGGEHGLLVAVDDAHHLDPASLALLAVVVADGTAQVALTTSDDHQPTPGLASLLLDDRSARMEVTPLARDDVDELVAAALGPVDDRLSEELWRLSQGNPLVLREVLADADGALTTTEDGRWTATGALSADRLASLAAHRLRSLDPDVADALTLVAVAAPIPYGVLAAAAPDLAVDRLLASGSAETGIHAGEQVVRPAHPLYGEVLLAALGDQARRATYRRLVAAARATDDQEIDPLRLAIWQHESGSLDDPEITAAGVVAALGRHDGALATTFLHTIEDHLDAPTAALWHGSALAQQGDHAGADASFARGLDPSHGTDDALVAELASSRAFHQAFGLQDPGAADETLVEASARVRDPRARTRLEGERGIVAGIGGDFQRALAAGRASVADPLTEGPALASAYVSLTLAEAMLGQLGAFAEHARAGTAAARAVAGTLPLAREQIRCIEADAHIVGGDVGRALDLVVDELADGRRLTRGLWLATLAYVHSNRGTARSAADAAREAIDQPGLREQFDLLGMAVGMRAIAGAQTGQDPHLAELEELADAHDDPRNAVWLRRGLAWVRATGGDLAGGITHAHDAGRHAVEGDHLGWGALALHDAIRMASGPEVATVAAELAAVVARTERAHLLETMRDHADALVDQDPAALLATARRFDRQGAWGFAADAAAQAAWIADRRSEATTLARADAWATVWLARCDHATTPATARRPRSEITPRALQIALDAVRGATSAQIAERRFVSVRTVDNHLGAAYRALGVNGRAELRDVLSPFSADGDTPRP